MTSDKPRIYDIVDSYAYVDGNCYQHQLGKALDEEFEVEQVELSQLETLQLTGNDKCLSRLRLRTLVANLDRVKKFANGCLTVVYDQDTWSNFLVGDPHFGCYRKIATELNLECFVGMSAWWAAKCREAHLPATAGKVWTRPEYCTGGKPWGQRSHSVVFSGAMYPERKRLFDELKAQGTNVEIVPTRNYNDYIALLGDSMVTVRSERKDWLCDFGTGPETVMLPHAQWQRDVEAASQGCYSVRESDLAWEDWGLMQVPLIRPVNEGGFAATINEALQCGDMIHVDHVARSLLALKGDPGWQTMTSAIRRGLYGFEDVYDRPEVDPVAERTFWDNTANDNR